MEENKPQVSPEFMKYLEANYDKAFNPERWARNNLKDVIRKFVGQPLKTIDVTPNRRSGWMKR
jgi:hypothetical protein